MLPMWIFDHLAPVANLLFCRWDNLRDLPSPNGVLIWNKGDAAGGLGDTATTYGRHYECIAFYRGKRHEFAEVDGRVRPRDMIEGVPMIPNLTGGRLHPAQKPVALMSVWSRTTQAPWSTPLWALARPW